MSDSVIGTEVEGYRIEEVLGRGGMGVVYRAEDVALSRDVALKRIDPTLANDEAFLRRFRSEARALARIDSPYIVSVHALRQTEIGLLLVMEYVEGGTLKDLTREGPMDWQEALPIIKQMLIALDHAHGAEVIHRDIKPQNVMLTVEETVKVTDFGLAKVHRPDSNKTVTQGVFGTLNYMSPEQVQGAANLDHRSDLYSLGMTIYEMVAGDLPFDDDSNEFTKMRRIVEEDLPPPNQLHDGVPDDLSALVMKALEKDPDDRFQSAQAMREAFEAFERTHRDESSSQSTVESEQAATASTNRWPLVAGLAVLVLLLLGGGFWLSAGQGLFAGRSGGAPTTQLSVFTQPNGATISVNDEEIGTSPLSGATIEGSTAQVRVQKAGFVTRDTTLAQLDGTQQLSLDVPLTREETSFTLRSNPEGAHVTVDGEDLGSTPAPFTTRKGTLRVHMEREGYFPGDTLLAVGQIRDQFEMQLDRRPRSDPPVGDNGGGSNQNNTTGDDSPSYGRLALAGSPAGSVSVEVDGDAYGTGEPVRVRVGSPHQIRITHPRHGTCDTTLTVEEGQTKELTCYFRHRVVVRSDPWAQVFLNGENTEESTTHTMLLDAGTTYEIMARILSRPYTVTEGTYRRIAAEGNEVVGQQKFQGNTTSITIRPSFERERHLVDFRTIRSESSP